MMLTFDLELLLLQHLSSCVVLLHVLSAILGPFTHYLSDRAIVCTISDSHNNTKRISYHPQSEVAFPLVRLT